MAIITKEIPTGVVDGVNQSFTLSNNISNIDDVWVDGIIYTGTNTYTVESKAFTLADAPTTSIYVDYNKS